METLPDSKRSRPGWYKTKQNKKNATKGQRRALKDLYPVWGIRMDYGEQFDLERIEKEFKRQAPTTLDIGFGTGATLVEMAKNDPGRNFIGIDWHAPGVGKALLEIKNSAVTNVRIICADAVTFLKLNVKLNPIFDTISVYFPDPWSRAQDHQQQQLRLLRKSFVTLASHSLVKGGLIHIATDVIDYVPPSIRLLKDALFTPHSTASADGIIPRPSWRPVTIYEQKGIDAGREVTDLLFVRPDSPIDAVFTEEIQLVDALAPTGAISDGESEGSEDAFEVDFDE
eukprot:TRINITY_DN22333_c0_g1_i1.p1 TRINITY_DN22333_c0_g1~~TRINITY_DN22333_c0_g1_i1.p1  ORF type:complete len:284 (+),score=40.07 TRINITY_DN22333_c0_g1_i1:59-910(+)